MVGANVTSSTYLGVRNYTAVEVETRAAPNVTGPGGSANPVYNNSVILFNLTAPLTSIIYWGINNGTGTVPNDEDLLNCGNSNDTSAFYKCGRALLGAG